VQSIRWSNISLENEVQSGQDEVCRCLVSEPKAKGKIRKEEGIGGWVHTDARILKVEDVCIFWKGIYFQNEQ